LSRNTLLFRCWSPAVCRIFLADLAAVRPLLSAVFAAVFRPRDNRRPGSLRLRCARNTCQRRGTAPRPFLFLSRHLCAYRDHNRRASPV